MPIAELEAILVAAIKPYVGETMASASVHALSTRLGLTGVVAEADRARLIDSLGLGMNVFVGKVKAAEIITALRAQLLKGAK